MLNEILKCGYIIKKRKRELIYLEKKTKVYDPFYEAYIDITYNISYDEKKEVYKTFDDVNLKAEIEANQDKGFVYLIECEGKYKIGFTRNIIQRMSFFKNTLPSYPRIVNYIVSNDYKRLEKSLHILFNEKRIKNEWFLLEENDLKTFDKIKNHCF